MFNLVEKFVYFLGWLRFVISPLLLFSLGGLVFYLKCRGNFGLIGGIAIAVFGLAAGIFLAEKVRRKNDIIDVLSREHGSGGNEFRANFYSNLFKKKK